MTDGQAPAIEVTNLRKNFGDLIAVDGLDLRVEGGAFFGFLGPNGAGKSTTIKILTGMLLPSAGHARILGHDIVDDAVAAKKITGVVSEEGALFERLTGAEYLEFIVRSVAAAGISRQPEKPPPPRGGLRVPFGFQLLVVSRPACVRDGRSSHPRPGGDRDLFRGPERTVPHLRSRRNPLPRYDESSTPSASADNVRIHR